MAERGSTTYGGPAPQEAKPGKHSDTELANVRGVPGCFTGAIIEPCEPCTAAEDRTCYIVRKLSVWNEFLCQSRLELRESSGPRGQLSLISFEKPWSQLPARQQMQQAMTLACGLLNTHRCVATLDISIMMEPSKIARFADALQGNAFVKVLRFRDPRFASRKTQEDICKLISSLPRLEELECTTVWKCPVTFREVLSRLLRTTTCLEALRLPMVCIKIHGAEGFLEALGKNRTLKELSLDESFICEASLSHRTGFAEYLKNTTTLTTLTILACNKTQDSLIWILKGLLGNNTVAELNLTNFIIDTESAMLMPTVFAKNTTLRKFSMISTMQDREMHDDIIYDHWLKALTENETMTVVRLPICAGKLDQWESLIRALPTKVNFRLTIEWNVTYYHLLPNICSALREAGAEKQVFFETNFPPDSADMLEYTGFSEIYACLRSDTVSEFSRIMHRLPSANHVTSVQLGIAKHTMNSLMSTLIANYIRGSVTLKNLHLILFSDPSLYVPRTCWTDIVTSLSQNVSVKELHVEVPDMEEQDTEVLARTVKSSKNMQRVYFVPESSHVACTFFKVLSKGIAENRTLLSVVVDASLDDKQAAKEWACAEALESACLHPALPEQVAELSSVSEVDALVKIRDAVISLQDMHNFMRLAGVVRKRVSCHRSEDGGAQLSDLNEDCWREVRRYLTFADIQYPWTQPMNV
ncbi:hypothetical protein HPB49_001862 [Dermacentor silvarum]|uniref:Uncharacterized protein n=1 Tax=Dermacentor silvarum TaxID=543639 RepID=A0ACB8D9Y7_DERSI|nr:hypothetical protein HPB49_001862 [Dermacentor silvarum]